MRGTGEGAMATFAGGSDGEEARTRAVSVLRDFIEAPIPPVTMAKLLIQIMEQIGWHGYSMGWKQSHRKSVPIRR